MDEKECVVTVCPDVLEIVHLETGLFETEPLTPFTTNRQFPGREDNAYKSAFARLEERVNEFNLPEKPSPKSEITLTLICVAAIIVFYVAAMLSIKAF